MNEYIRYNIVYHILICRQCGFAIPQDGIMRHFRQFHKTIPLVICQDIINYGLSLDLWHPSQVHEQWQNMNVKSPVDSLTIHPGFKCQHNDCLKYTRTEVSNHYSKWKRLVVSKFLCGKLWVRFPTKIKTTKHTTHKTWTTTKDIYGIPDRKSLL